MRGGTGTREGEEFGSELSYGHFDLDREAGSSTKKQRKVGACLGVLFDQSYGTRFQSSKTGLRLRPNVCGKVNRRTRSPSEGDPSRNTAS